MLRSFVLLLLLIIVFLSGIIIGSDREKNYVAPIDQLESEMNYLEHTDEKNGQVFFMNDSNSESDGLDTEMIEHGKNHTTQKIATFLETGVKKFYEVVVHVLYQIASLFF